MVMSKSKKRELNIASKVIHVGGEADIETGAIIPPIYQTSTYVQSAPGEHKGYEYTRSHNPTRSRLEECLAALEGGAHALVTASGMSAITLIAHALPHNARILCGDDVYGGTYRIFTTVFNKSHKIEFVDTTNYELLEKKMSTFSPEILWIETPTNPLLKITDIQKVCEMAKKHNVITVVDNTFMSPYFQNPLKLGADIVVHSMTKYIGGHSDVIGGAIITSSKEFYDKLWTLQNSIGPCQSPFDSWLTLRGLKTLAVRMKSHEDNALEIAAWLEGQDKVENVIYPGLKSHPQYDIAREQMSGFGGMMTFFLKGSLNESKNFLSKLQIFSLAESLGGVESLVEHPAIMTHASVPLEVREKLGICNNLIRLSVGIENVDDLKKDILQGLKALL